MTPARWGEECAGCNLYRKNVHPWGKFDGEIALVWPSMPTDDWEARSVDWPTPALSGMRVDLAPMLRCPGFVDPDDLARAFRGETKLQRYLGRCDSQAQNAPKAICLGEQAFTPFVANRLKLSSRTKVKFNEVWGSVLEVPCDNGVQEVYIASRWYRKDCPREMREVDFERIPLWLKGRLVEPTPVAYEVLSPREAFLWLRGLDRSVFVTADIETGPGEMAPTDQYCQPAKTKEDGFRPHTGHLRCIGLHAAGRHVLVPEVSVTGKRIYPHTHMAKLLQEVVNHRSIWHNAGFDLWWLAQRYGVVPTADVEDTMLLHRHVYEECPHSLAVACSLEWYTGSWKSGLGHGLEARDDAELWQYCVQDVANTWRLFRVLVRKWKERY